MNSGKCLTTNVVTVYYTNQTLLSNSYYAIRNFYVIHVEKRQAEKEDHTEQVTFLLSLSSPKKNQKHVSKNLNNKKTFLCIIMKLNENTVLVSV